MILSSPLVMGFISSLLKTLQERFLPLAHPFLFMHDDRMQHVPRYEKYPSTILLLEKTDAHDGADIEITENIFKGLKTRKFMFSTMDKNREELSDEIDNI